MANPALTDDVVARWRPLSEQEEINAQTFLDDAWRMLRRAIPGLVELIETDNELDAEDQTLEAEVVRVLVTAVLRVMKNPDGKRQESIDDYSWQRDQSVAAGVLYFTSDELGDLIPDADGRSGAFTVDMLSDYASRFDS